MRRRKQYVVCKVLLLWLLAAFLAPAYAGEYPVPSTYAPRLAEVEKHKKFFDDPRPYLKDFGPKTVLPKELYSFLSYDREKMRKEWAELVGFEAPNLVGKIAPEIKPGKYTYKDVQNNLKFKELMWADQYNRVKPGGPPLAGNIPEFEIIPTQQYYWALPVAEMTKRNLGKTKLDSKGYLIEGSWEGGIPFPRPSGPQKAQQIMYNLEKRYLNFGYSFYMIARVQGFDKNLSTDFNGIVETKALELRGRCLFEPYGYYDERAKTRGEDFTFSLGFDAPRDVAGTVTTGLFYDGVTKPDNLLIYIPSMRRIRKMTSSDTQDPVMGQDLIYDDHEGWMQKLSPTRYPYKFEVIGEREYLVVAPTVDGSEYFGSKGKELRNVRMERRPIYVVKLTQSDPSYVYSYRVFYVDRETYMFYHVENFDRKGRLYRTWDMNYGFDPGMGAWTWSGAFMLMRDLVDVHSSIQQPYVLPAAYTRGDVNIEGFAKMKEK
jgi:hypothetical protein